MNGDSMLEYFETVKTKLNNIKKNHEIEFSFDTTKMNVSLEQFKNLMLAYKKRAEIKSLALLLENTLDVSYKHDAKNATSYRVTIHGLEQINNFISKFAIQDKYNHIVFIDALTSIQNGTPEFSIMEKIKNRDDRVDNTDQNIRFRLSLEAPVSEHRIKELQKLSIHQTNQINFRYKTRMSLILFSNDDITIRSDLTEVYTTKRLKGIQSTPPSFELEIEMTCKRDLKQVKAEYLDLLFKEVRYTMKILQGSNILISEEEKANVMDSFSALLNVPQKNNKDLPAMQSYSAELIHVVEYIPNNYALTDKADGERRFIYIINDNIYYITNSLQVIKLNSKEYNKKNITSYNGTIIDGEFINVPKNNKSLFLAFDVLVFKGEDVRDEAMLSKRYNYLLEATHDVFNQKYVPKKYDKPFSVKNLVNFYKEDMAKYMQKLNDDLKNGKDNKNIVTAKYFIFPTGGNPCEIYAYSVLMWDLYTSDSGFDCPYKLDGLVYTPLNQKYTTKVSEMSRMILKWKPKDKNSIDFYVLYEKDNETNKISNVFDNAIAESLDDEERHENEELDNKKVKGKIYRILNLYVGGFDKGNEYPVLFQKNQGNHIANIFVENGEARDIEGNIIGDATVVEFAYNNDINVPPAFRWVPLRTRFDKTESVRKYKRKYGNAEVVADKIWRSMNDGIELSDLKALGDEQTYSDYLVQLRKRISNRDIIEMKNLNKYYQVSDRLVVAFRDFHNCIKTSLIHIYCSLIIIEKNKKKGMDVLDVACGRGGDISKFYHARVNSYVGFDKSDGNIYSSNDGALSRYTTQRKKYPSYPPMKFLVADATCLLNYEDQSKALTLMSDTNKLLLKEIFGDNQQSKNHRVFDLVNCQFAIHYFFVNDIALNNFCQNIKKFLKPGGFLLVSVFDGKLLHDSFGEAGKITKYYTTDDGKKEVLYEIVRQYPGDTADIKQTGLQIDVKMSWIQSDAYIPEYLVDQEFLVSALGSKAGLKLVETESFAHLKELYKTFFSEGYKHESVKKTFEYFTKVKEYYNTSDDIVNQCQTYTKLTRFYIFQKI